MSNYKKDFLVAQFGRTVGLKGELKLNLHTDFPEQFIKGRKLSTDRGVLEIENYNPKRGLIKLVGINNPEDAKRFTNTKIYSSEEETREYCKLKDGQYFWFDIIGASVVENSETLGVVKDIQRLPQGDYLLVDTDSKLVENGFAKSFLIPYIPQFVSDVDTDSKIVEVVNSKDILEAS